jgi:protein-S-isoprenylcysteine O-methyltransferase Ste14
MAGRQAAGPVAQGPEINPDHRLSIGDPYLWSRHPLNFSAILIFCSRRT